MSQKTRKLTDVFLSHAAVDTGLAEGVVRSFQAAGLEVFPAAGLGANAGEAAEVRRRLQQSVAFVALLTPTLAREDAFTIEIGAAWAGSTPIYLLLSEIRKAEIPSYLRRYPAVPLWAGLEGVIEEVRKRAEPFSDEERAILIRAYQEVGLPVDRLIAAPAAGDRLAELFAEQSDRKLHPGRLVRELLRIRKSSKLPKLTRQTTA